MWDLRILPIRFDHFYDIFCYFMWKTKSFIGWAPSTFEMVLILYIENSRISALHVVNNVAVDLIADITYSL